MYLAKWRVLLCLHTRNNQLLLEANDNEFVYQNDFFTYNAGDWNITETAAASTQAANYANGFLSIRR